MRAGLPVLDRVVDWRCPNCGLRQQTRERRPHTRFHPCPRLAGVQAPMIVDGVKAKVYAVERQDYVGRERVQTDANGRPIMAVVTVRDEGQDAIVFAPTATGMKED